MSATTSSIAKTKAVREIARPRERLQQIDILRGAIMIIMALDHTRDFVHWAAQKFQPEDLARTTPAIFFTRWITHFCAPVFMFTAGLGAFFYWQHGRTKAQLSHFLWTRGLWLIVLEVTVSRFSLFFSFDYTAVILIVLWALGISMIVLAGLIYLPMRWLAALSIATIALHNLLDGVPASRFGAMGWLWTILHQRGAIKIGNHLLVIGYPIVPWFAVMALGFCFGPVFLWEPERRKRFLVRTGLAMTTAFVVVRAINVYGDLFRWSHQDTVAMTVVSFLNTTKYPPSLLFLLMTLGPAIAVLGWLEGVRLRDANPLLVFGRTPMFYYLIHLYIAHLLAVAVAYARYGRFLWDPLSGRGTSGFPADYGYSLAATYAAWMTVVALSYPLCRWFAGVKRRRRDWWLSYL